LNQEALALQADGVDIIQFDEPAFNVYLDQAADWGVKALERAAQGLTCTTAVHICYGYGIEANNELEENLGPRMASVRKGVSSPGQEQHRTSELGVLPLARTARDLMALLEGKDVMVGVIDVASDVIETPEEVADTIGRALQFVPKHRLIACTNCGLAPMSREVATKKLQALAAGAALARQRYA
jgi:5-methyltetrahydropteroyltriglutamate--homocysteine methyltransferase